MLARRQAIKKFELIEFWKDRGANDAEELGFKNYDGGLHEEYENAYNLGYERRVKQIENEAREELHEIGNKDAIPVSVVVNNEQSI